MILVATSDWHRDYLLEGVARADEIDRAIEQSVKHAVKLKRQGEHVVYGFLGDLCNPYDCRSHAAVAKAVYTSQVLHEHAIPSFWLPGNHDVIEDGSMQHALMALRGLLGPHVLDVPGAHSVEVDDGVLLHVLALPYTAVADDYDPAEVVENVQGSIDLVVGHLNLEGITTGSETSEMARGRNVFWPIEALDKKFPNVPRIGGHYHEAQEFKGVTIVGAPARLTFGEEANNPSFVVRNLG